VTGANSALLGQDPIPLRRTSSVFPSLVRPRSSHHNGAPPLHSTLCTVLCTVPKSSTTGPTEKRKTQNSYHHPHHTTAPLHGRVEDGTQSCTVSKYWTGRVRYCRSGSARSGSGAVMGQDRTVQQYCTVKDGRTTFRTAAATHPGTGLYGTSINSFIPLAWLSSPSSSSSSSSSSSLLHHHPASPLQVSSNLACLSSLSNLILWGWGAGAPRRPPHPPQPTHTHRRPADY